MTLISLGQYLSVFPSNYFGTGASVLLQNVLLVLFST